MRRFFLIALMFSVVCVAGRATAEMKIAVVDIETLVKSHPNTKSDKALIKEQLDDYEAEREKIEGRVRQLQKSYEKAVAEAQNPALSEKARREMAANAGEAAAELKGAQRRAVETVRGMQKDLTESELRMFRRTLKEIEKEIAKYAKEESYDLILDAAAQSSGARGMVTMPSVVYASDAVNVTSVIMERIGGTSMEEEPEE